jgi:hypothetical protein
MAQISPNGPTNSTLAGGEAHLGTFYIQTQSAQPPAPMWPPALPHPPQTNAQAASTQPPAEICPTTLRLNPQAAQPVAPQLNAASVASDHERRNSARARAKYNRKHFISRSNLNNHQQGDVIPRLKLHIHHERRGLLFLS